MANTNRAVLGGFVALVAALGAGCGQPPDTRPARHPTKGTLTYNGKPLKGAVVTFWPVPVDKADWKTVKPQAVVEADGSYQPNSYDLKDGAVTREYAVTVLYTGEGGGPGPDLLRGAYSDPQRPVARVTIVVGENVVDEIRLESPKPAEHHDPKTEHNKDTER